jgi:hypothetical protein
MFAAPKHSFILPILVQDLIIAAWRIGEGVSFERVSGSSVCLFYGCDESRRRLA